jgi:CheY-like chemotaxis protein
VGASTLTKPLRILLVEDEPTLGGLLGAALAQLGHEVCPIARSEPAALEAVATLQPDLLIVDVSSIGPGEFAAIADGQSAPAIPHVFIAAIARSAETFRPGVAVLRMPVSIAQLARAIERVVEPGPPEKARASHKTTAPHPVLSQRDIAVA